MIIAAEQRVKACDVCAISGIEVSYSGNQLLLTRIDKRGKGFKKKEVKNVKVRKLAHLIEGSRSFQFIEHEF